MEALGPIIGWLAPILSTIIITAATASINAPIKRHDQLAEERNAKTEEKRKADAEWRESVDKLLEEQSEALRAVTQDFDDWHEWRAAMVECMGEQDKKLDALTDGVQTTMRTDLIHLYEKFTTRGWITPEERAAWHDMHTKYSALNANGLIDSYSAKLDELPDREI